MLFALTKRHIKVFFRNRGAVFFSLLSPLILFVLYYFFLGSMNLESLKEKLPGIDEATLRLFLNSWVYAGIVMTAAVTTGLAALEVFVNDRESGRFIDFAVSPLPRWKVVVSYLLSTMAIATIITTLVYIASQIHLMVLGAAFPSVQTIAQTVGSYLLITFSFAALSSLVVTFMKSTAAFTSLSIIIGTGIGFVAGIYVPLGTLSASIANVLNALPFAQAAALLRAPFTHEVLVQIGHSQPVQLVHQLKDTYGLSVAVGDTTITAPLMILYLTALGVVALILAILRISKKVR